VLNGVLEGEDTALGLCLITDVGVSLLHTNLNFSGRDVRGRGWTADGDTGGEGGGQYIKMNHRALN
jgi:hypothetical protein